MDPMSSLADTAAYYEGFARDYAKGESPTYLDWSLGGAGDPDLLGRLGELPPPRRQPNLLFAAARHHGAPAPGPFAAMRETVLGRWSEVSATMRSRSTQTNEPGRCATLLPVLDEIARDHADKLDIYKLDIDANPEITASKGITSVPTLHVYQGGELVKVLTGAQAKPKLLRELEPFLG